MKKPQFKLLKEFRDFISRGSVLDLAVGMIIGAAFTAIITAVVNNILQPLINLIPINADTGLITVLRNAVYDDAGNIVTEALVINWGAVISAVVTFLLTAVVLFAIIKAMNVAKTGASKLKNVVVEKVEAQLFDDDKKAQDAQDETPAEVQVNAEAPAATEQASIPAADETTIELLKEIRDLLKKQSEN